MRYFSLCVVAAFWGASQPAIADTSLPTCTRYQEQDCSLTWVENNQKSSIRWSKAEGDFAPAAMSGDLLISQRPPELVDIDRDGWMELVTFSRIAGFTGDLDIFRRPSPQGGFAHFGTMHGSNFFQDPSGYFVSAVEADGDITYFTFHDLHIDAGLLRQFGLKVEVNNEPHCVIQRDGRLDVSVSDNPDLPERAEPEMIRNYCSEPGAPSGVVPLSSSLEEVLVPAGTVFHCHLDDGTHSVTVSEEDGVFHYRYGPIGGEAELHLNSVDHTFTRFTDYGPGPYERSDMIFENGRYAYILYYDYELLDRSGDDLPAFGPYPNKTFKRGLFVIKDGDYQNKLFDRTCILETSYDEIDAP